VFGDEARLSQASRAELALVHCSVLTPVACPRGPPRTRPHERRKVPRPGRAPSRPQGERSSDPSLWNQSSLAIFHPQSPSPEPAQARAGPRSATSLPPAPRSFRFRPLALVEMQVEAARTTGTGTNSTITLYSLLIGDFQELSPEPWVVAGQVNVVGVSTQAQQAFVCAA
jgi:hypothetical protein